MNVDACLDRIFHAISPALLERISGTERTTVSVAYRKYLIDEYGSFLEELKKTPDKEEDALGLLEKKERERWESLTGEQIRARLLPDRGLKDLAFLSELAFQEACKCLRSGEFKTSGAAYEEELFRLSQCLDGISSYHLDYAKELLSEALLDVDFAYGRSDSKSLRLARVVEKS